MTEPELRWPPPRPSMRAGAAGPPPAPSSSAAAPAPGRGPTPPSVGGSTLLSAGRALGLPHALAVLALGLGVGWAVVGAGAGIALTLVLLGALLLAGARSLVLMRSATERCWDLAGLAVGAGLAVAAVARDLRGLGALAVLGVMAACAWSGLADGRWRALIPGLLAWVPRAVVAPVALAQPLRALGTDRGARSTRRLALPVLRGVGLAVVLLGVFGALFASADPAFARVARQALLVDIDAWSLTGRLLAGLVTALVVTGITTCGTPLGALLGEPTDRPPPRRAPAAGRDAAGWAAAPVRRRSVGVVEWAIALSALDLLFGAFVLLQLPLLFGGQDFVLAAADVTLAGHARAGFAQLVVVAALVLAVVAMAVRWARRERTTAEMGLRALLGVLLLFTVVVLASAAVRLDAYVGAFGQTRLRLAVQTSFWWFATIFALVLAAGLRVRAGAAWLPRACVLVTGIALLGHLASGPDARIAARNVGRFAATGEVDLVTLRGLSADALPALATLGEPERSCVLAAHAERLGMTEPDLAGLNLGRARGRRVLERVARELDPTTSGWPWGAGTPCPDGAGPAVRLGEADISEQDPGMAPS